MGADASHVLNNACPDFEEPLPDTDKLGLGEDADQMRRFDRCSAAFARSRFTADVSCARMASGDIANPVSW